MISNICPPSIPHLHACMIAAFIYKSRDLESFIILNFVVLYSSVFKLCFMSLPCSLNHNTLNSVRKKVGSGKLG